MSDNELSQVEARLRRTDLSPDERRRLQTRRDQLRATSGVDEPTAPFVPDFATGGVASNDDSGSSDRHGHQPSHGGGYSPDPTPSYGSSHGGSSHSHSSGGHSSHDSGSSSSHSSHDSGSSGGGGGYSGD
jgi:hypothetical protein